MAELPVLVVHGALIWKLLWLVLVTGTFGVAFAIRRRRARLRARDRRAVLLGEVRSPKVGPSVIRGRVTTGTATTTYRRSGHADAPATLVLDCDGATVEIDGPVHVEEGGRVRAWPWPTVERSVDAGDEVLATGVLAEAHAAEDASYREAKIRWQLAGNPTVIALAPRVKAFPLTAGALIGATLVFGLGWYGALRTFGSFALHRAEYGYASARDGVLPSFGAAELAAAMPGSRDRALDALDRQLIGLHIAASERALQLELAVAELRGLCPARILAEQARFEEALAAARRCDRDEVAMLLALLGNYAEAERELAPTDTSDVATAIHIATGNWKAAAVGADTHATEVSTEIPNEYRSAHYIHDAANGQHCLAALFRVYEGDARAFAPLDLSSPVCAVFEAEAMSPGEQATAFARIPRTKLDAESAMSAGLDLITDELAFAAGEPRDSYYGGEAVSATMFLFDRTRIWLAPFQLETHPTSDVALANMTSYELLRGDLAAARACLEKITTPYLHDELATGLALRDGSAITDPHAERAGFEEPVALRRGVVDSRIQSYLGEQEGAETRALLTRAAAGDGLALVEFLQLDRLQWRAFAIPMLGLLPRIVQHRPEVLAALRMFRNDLGSFAMTQVPFNVLGDMIAYRDIARLAGDTEDASHWQAIIDRHVAVLRDRRKLTALLFWHD